MKPGRELDALIAEHVFGNVTEAIEEFMRLDNLIGPLDPNEGIFPSYSTNISAAWMVVEKLYTLDTSEPMILKIYGPLSDGYEVEIVWEHHDGPIPQGRVVAETAPLAICIAALRALGVEL